MSNINLVKAYKTLSIKCAHIKYNKPLFVLLWQIWHLKGISNTYHLAKTITFDDYQCHCRGFSQAAIPFNEDEYTDCTLYHPLLFPLYPIN